MMRTKLFLLLFSGFLFLGCGSSSKTPVSAAKSKALDEMIGEKSFEIQSDWALPLATASLNSIANSGLLNQGNSAARINLIGNANYFRMEGDTLSAHLPYFGERQMGGGYDRDGGGIKFKGVPKDYEIIQDEGDHHYEIRFSINDRTETFNVTTMLFPNLTSTINVSSSQRFPIRYQGKVAPITKE